MRRSGLARSGLARRWLPAVAVTLLILALGPAGSYVTRWGRVTPRLVIGLLGAVFALAVLGLLAWAVARLRADLARRLPWIVAALGLVALQQLVLGDRGSPLERTVERMHVLLFGALAATLWTAAREPSRAGKEAPTGGGAAASCAFVGVAWVAILDELVQDALMARTGEAFDLGLNLFSGAVGLLAAVGVFPMRWRAAEPRSRGRVLLLAAPLPLFLALFLDLAHLGARLEVPGLGAFHSFYSQPALERANRARQRLWAQRLPAQPPFGWWVLQDDFLVEGGWHVQARNRALEERDLLTVWIENTILERFYSALLETGFPEEVHPYRLKSWDLERLAAAGPFDPSVAVDGDGLASRADRGRIWVVPTRAQSYGVASLLSVVLAVAAWRGRARR
jgi:hypothetical protein